MIAKLEVVGGGKMGEALVAGLVAARWAEPSEILVVEAVMARREELAGSIPGLGVSPDPVAAEGVVLAVKPADAEAAARSVAPLAPARVLSVMAGVRIDRLQEWVGAGVAVVRAMPNTPALIGAGAAAISPGPDADEADLEWAEGILSAVGIVERVPERLLDAVTGLSGSGPAYVFLVTEAMIEAGVLNGLPRAAAESLAVRTVLGAARLMAESGQGPESLRAAVTSPGGTTAAGLRSLEDHAVRSAFLDAITVAAERSRELGSS